jgi:hypothetical protein
MSILKSDLKLLPVMDIHVSNSFLVKVYLKITLSEKMKSSLEYKLGVRTAKHH